MKNIGEIIRELRKRDGITQEKLAESLGVSFQSVSRWENGLAWPDVTLIPFLARYFKVSADTLFDMENWGTAEREEYYDTTYAQYRRDGKLALRRELMEQAVREFPHRHHYMMNLAEDLEAYADGTRAQREEYAENEFSGRIRRLCQRVLEECRDSRERSRGVKLLCSSYVSAGNLPEALRLAQEAWDMEHCREVLLGQILSGEEKLHQLQENMLKAVDYTATTMVGMVFCKDVGLADGFSNEEKIQYILTANRLYETLMPDGNYQFYHRTVGWNYRRLAELSLLKKDRREALRYLLLAEREACAFDNLQEFRYTSPVLDRLEFHPEDHAKCWEGSERGMLYYRLKELEGYFASSEELEGFRKLMERLKDDVAQEVPVQIE